MGAAGPETLQRQWLAKLEKMDSFIAESLRVNQPILCMLKPRPLSFLGTVPWTLGPL
jgi:hypothetical protein